VIAIVAVFIWAATELPPIYDRWTTHQMHADAEGELERGFREQYRERLAQASRLRADFDRMRGAMKRKDEMTERYLAVRWESAAADAQHLKEVADSHGSLAQICRRAMWSPWVIDPFRTSDRRVPPSPSTKSTGRITEQIDSGDAVAFAPGGAGLAVA